MSKDEIKESGRPIRGEQSGIRIQKQTPQESQLYQKINEFIGHGRIDGKDIPNPQYEKMSIIETVGSFLDEAKAEYPMAKEIVTPDDENDGKGWKQVAIVMEQKTLERQRWFKKWFGSGAP